MPTSVISVKVLAPGERAEELLHDAAKRLQMAPSRQMGPDVAQFWFDNATTDEAYEAVQAALDGVGGDWPDHLLLPRPGA